MISSIVNSIEVEFQSCYFDSQDGPNQDSQLKAGLCENRQRRREEELAIKKPQ